MSEIDNSFEFCPKCGQKNVSFVKNKWFCSDCGFTLYCNVAAAVGLVIVDDENVLLEVRAKEPRKGFFALPGGFCDLDECAENSVVRECKEELGLDISDFSYLCSFPNTYDYKSIRYKTCDLFFCVKCESGKLSKLLENAKIQRSEVSNLVLASIRTEKEIDEIPLAFESARKTLKFYLKNKKL